MYQKTFRRQLASTIAQSKAYAADNQDHALTGGKWAAYRYLLLGSQRYIGATSAIISLRRPSDYVVLANSVSMDEFKKLLEEAKNRIEGGDIVQDMKNVLTWKDFKKVPVADGDVWFDSCQPTLEHVNNMYDDFKKRGSHRFIIATGFQLKLSEG